MSIWADRYHLPFELPDSPYSGIYGLIGIIYPLGYLIAPTAEYMG